MTVLLDQQIEEVERELKLRRDVYPRLIAANKMRKGVADFHIERLDGVLRTLQWFKSNEMTIRHRMSNDQ